MSVTLEQAHILVREMNMDTSCFQHALDAMRRYPHSTLCSLPTSYSPFLPPVTHTHSRGTRLRNAQKNVGVPLYAFNALQVFALPPVYRPPEGTYKKLQT